MLAVPFNQGKELRSSGRGFWTFGAVREVGVCAGGGFAVVLGCIAAVLVAWLG